MVQQLVSGNEIPVFLSFRRLATERAINLDDSWSHDYRNECGNESRIVNGGHRFHCVSLSPVIG